jgi:hypothetical protein
MRLSVQQAIGRGRWRAVASGLPLLMLLYVLGGVSAAQAQVPRTITLEAPVSGAVVASPVTVRGRVTISPFENNLRGRVYDAAGRVVGEGPVAVTPNVPGSLGGPGTFAAQLSFAVTAVGPGRVEVADVSAADGSLFASASANVTLGGPGIFLPRTGAAAGVPSGLRAALASFGLLAGAAALARARRRIAA